MRHKDPERMKNIAKFIDRFYARNERTPYVREIAEEFDIAKSTAHAYLIAMAEADMLDYSSGEIKTSSMEKIKISREPMEALGSVVCGDPVAEEEHLEYITSLPTAVFGRGPFYLLRAKGDSMVDEAITEGDMLVIRKTSEAHKGDIVVALDENNENTLKMYMGQDRRTGKYILAYCNKAVYGNKTIRVNQFVCQGVLSHIIKER